MVLITRLEFCLVTAVCRGDFGVSQITSGSTRSHTPGLPGPTDNTGDVGVPRARAQQTTPPGLAQRQTRAVALTCDSADLGDQLSDDVAQLGDHVSALPRVLAVQRRRGQRQ